jgi:nucleoid-associated protein YgaU
LSSIAHEWFGDENKWSLIARENPQVDPNRLKIGQKLRMPAKNATAPSVKEEVADRESTYTVRSGDTLSKIARDYYGDISKWKAIYDANKSAIGSDPANLKPGMKLKLPSKSAS